ncbi:MAG: 3'-5' exonuclease [Actinomycetia bacterium]|nr:3'-5' exonuclease [Actinomycetes bacterium]
MSTPTAIILDTETTTNKETPERPLEVVELAWMPLREPGGKFFRYKPTMPPTFGATAVHHILMSELEGCAPSSSAPQDVPPATYWIGHNIDFDWKALGQPPVRRICTLAMSRHLWPECDSHTLSAMMYFTQGCTPETRERLRNAHSALSDCEFVLDLLATIRSVTKITTLEALWSFSEEARIPRIWTFGKFKDQPIGAADRGYASWCARQPDMDPYVLAALRREGLLR